MKGEVSHGPSGIYSVCVDDVAAGGIMGRSDRISGDSTPPNWTAVSFYSPDQVLPHNARDVTQQFRCLRSQMGTAYSVLCRKDLDDRTYRAVPLA